MPRSLQEILDNADALAEAFEAMGEDDTEVEVLDGAPLRQILAAARARAQAEQVLLDAVVAARHAGFPWDMIGSYLGTSGEAARQRYGALITPSEPPGKTTRRVPPAKKSAAKKASAKPKKAAPKSDTPPTRGRRSA